MTIINSDRETAFAFSEDQQQVVIKANVVLAPPHDNWAISDAPGGPSSAFNLCTIANYGAVYCPRTAVQIYGHDATILNFATGSIVGSEAAYIGGLNAYVGNLGYMHGDSDAIFLDGSGAVISNAGTISADFVAIDAAGGASFRLYNSGVIDGGSYSLAMDDPGAATVKVFNSGRMVGAVLFQTASFCVVHNTGQIEGAVTFGASNDRFDGRGGASGEVWGGDGADSLWGGAADDTLYGGAGSDRMKGGGGADTFVYHSITDSRGAGIDIIGGWDASDVLDLSQIDANAGKAGIQPLVFGGQIAPTDPVGNDQVEYYRKAGNTFVVADLNGDGVADFTIKLVGAYTLDDGDFILG